MKLHVNLGHNRLNENGRFPGQIHLDHIQIITRASTSNPNDRSAWQPPMLPDNDSVSLVDSLTAVPFGYTDTLRLNSIKMSRSSFVPDMAIISSQASCGSRL